MQGGDRRRFGAPPGSTPLTFRTATTTSASPQASTSAQRLDDRQPQQVRPIFLQTGLVSEASGSAYIETGRTKLICCVYGPKPTPPSAPFNPKARLNVEVKFSPFSSGVRRFIPGKDTEAGPLSATLHQSILPSLILSALPKSQIDLFVTILESDGSDSEISAGVTAASIALAEAGIQMYGLVTACCAAFVPSAPQPFLDPTRLEAKEATAFVSLACIPALGTVTNLGMRGNLEADKFEKVLETCFQTCAQIHFVAKNCLMSSNAT